MGPRTSATVQRVPRKGKEKIRKVGVFVKGKGKEAEGQVIPCGPANHVTDGQTTTDRTNKRR